MLKKNYTVFFFPLSAPPSHYQVSSQALESLASEGGAHCKAKAASKQGSSRVPGCAWGEERVRVLLRSRRTFARCSGNSSERGHHLWENDWMIPRGNQIQLCSSHFCQNLCLLQPGQQVAKPLGRKEPRMIISRSIHVAANGIISFFFMVPISPHPF